MDLFFFSMHVTTVFLVVFIPFILFIAGGLWLTKKQGPSALPLPIQTYEPPSFQWVGWMGSSVFVLIPVFLGLVFLLGFVVKVPVDPAFAPSWLVPVLAGIYVAAVSTGFLIYVVMVWDHWRHGIAHTLVLDAVAQTVRWTTPEGDFTVNRDAFVRAERFERLGRHPVGYTRYSLSNGETRCISMYHPGYYPVMEFCKHLAPPIDNRNMPFISPASGNSWISRIVRMSKRLEGNYVYYYLGIIAFGIGLCCIQYYKNRQQNLDNYLPMKQVEVLKTVRRNTPKNKNWVYLQYNNKLYEQNVDGAFFKEAQKNNYLNLYYSEVEDRFLMQTTDFRKVHFFMTLFTMIILALIARVIWLFRREVPE